jgi:hypothetical protein
MQFYPTCIRRYQEVKVDITDRDPVQALRDALPLGAQQDIYRFRLTGMRRESLNAAALAALVKGKFFSVQLLDETRQETGLWDRLEEDNLTGLFLRNLKTRMDNATPEELPLLEQAARYGLCALEGREEPR